MTYVVGAKGQVVIAKDIRDRLGILPGWVAVQRLEGDEVHLSFLPPEHDRSLRGCLSQYVKPGAPSGEDWERVRRQAWESIARERETQWTDEG